METPPHDSTRETREASRADIRDTLTTIDQNALTPEERSLLESLLKSLTPRAVETTPSSETVPQHETSLESRVQSAFEIIQTNQKLTFFVSAIGNVLNQPRGSTEGSRTFYFDVHSGRMLEDKRVNNFLDRDPQHSNTLFQDVYTRRKEDGYTYIVKRCNILPDANNPFVTDRRGGVHFTLAVRFRPEDIDSFENELTVKELHEPRVEFFSLLFDHCARTYIPEYYSYIQQLSAAYRARHTPPQEAP